MKEPWAMNQAKRRKTSYQAGLEMDVLETREVLSQVISGVDIDGDTWFLRLIGPGTFRVINQPDSSGNDVPLGTPALIQSIEIAGTANLASRMVGEVKQGPNGDGKVFFQSLSQFGGNSLAGTSNNGLYAIDIPNFWLGITQSNQTAALTADIQIDNGVNTLRFGGVDMTASPGGGIPAPATNAFADKASIKLGLPSFLGTSIYVDKFVSDTKAGTTAAQPINDEIDIETIGRINAIQANEISGNPEIAPTGYLGGGGTIVRSSGEYLGQAIQSNIVGAIGQVMVRNNATNFSVQSGTSIRRLNIGGETKNVFALGVNGIRYAQFGLGMDSVTIHAHTMSRLEMARGAVGSEVKTTRQMGYFRSGGDVINSTILAGINQNLQSEFRQQTASTDTLADLGGAINAQIAGNVIDSIFAASYEPSNGSYDSPNAMALGGGKIDAKIEGTIDNSGVTPDAPNVAFYAFKTNVNRGPVAPPYVPSTPAETPAKFTRIPTGNFNSLGRPFPSNKKMNSTFALWNVTSYLRKTNPKI
jgi:hypothetical protein